MVVVIAFLYLGITQLSKCKVDLSGFESSNCKIQHEFSLRSAAKTKIHNTNVKYA